MRDVNEDITVVFSSTSLNHILRLSAFIIERGSLFWAGYRLTL
jgi:hypothetical protein